MPNRVIKSTAHAAARTVNDVLRSIFALELFSPSKAIYLISPWITDFALLDNAFGQFRVLLPEENDNVRLSSFLNALVEQGSSIYVLSRPGLSNDFLMRLHPNIERKTTPSLHEKSFLTDHFYLRGSMNFTHSGLNRNDEHVEVTTELADLAQARIAAQTLWEGIGE